MIKADKYFKDNLINILDNGNWDKEPRAKYKDGTPAYSKFITQVFEKYDLTKNEFPITTLRNTAVKTGIKEIQWIYLEASNSLNKAKQMGVNWWNNWNVGDNTIGRRYGYTVNKYCLFEKLIQGLMTNPFGRRHIINLWQEQDFIDDTKGLNPCAYETLWSVREKDNCYYLDMTLIQRSSDYIMAGYINKSQYVALMFIVKDYLNKFHTGINWRIGIFSHLVQNLHIYDRHLDAANEIICRKSGYQPIMLYNCNGNFDVIGLSQGKKLDSPLEIAI